MGFYRAGAAGSDTIPVLGRSVRGLPPATTVTIAMRFTDYADPRYMYMLHCHNLIHEDAGIMLGLMVR